MYLIFWSICWKICVSYSIFPFHINSWDEWLGSENLLKHNEANIRKQKELKEKHSGEKSAKPGRPSQDKAKNFTGWSYCLSF